MQYVVFGVDSSDVYKIIIDSTCENFFKIKKDNHKINSFINDA